jgi:hypothetical protein
MLLKEHSWDIKLNHKNGLSYYTIKNIFDEDEIERFYHIFNQVKPHLLPPEHSGSALDENKKPLKNNKAIFTDKIKPYPGIFLDFEKKLGFHRNKMYDLLGDNKEDSVYALLPSNINTWNSLISYYCEDNHNYKAHSDNSILTFLMWLDEREKNFTGGELRFPKYDITIECEDNTGVLFPSRVLHEVLDVKIIDKNKDKGRITYSTFLGNDIFLNNSKVKR